MRKPTDFDTDLDQTREAIAAGNARVVRPVRPAPTVGDDLDGLVKSLRYGDQHASAAECRNDLCNCAIMEEAATALTTLRERVARLEGLLRELEDTLTPAEQVPPKDPAYGDEVRALGLRIGFGALMASASHEWRQWLADNGYPLGSEFVAGPCRAVLESDLRRARTAIGE